MSVNKYQPHVWIVIEDDANRQVVNGFLLHPAVIARAIGVSKPAGGWQRVLDVFQAEYIPWLRNYKTAFVVMVIDFDERFDDRRPRCQESIPDDLNERVFVIGARDDPEALRGELHSSLEAIGRRLADDCGQDDLGQWGNPHLNHNRPELQRMVQALKPFVLQED